MYTTNRDSEEKHVDHGFPVAVKEPSEIDSVSQGLAHSITVLREDISDLQNRLAPILPVPQPVAEEDRGKSAPSVGTPSYQCPLARTIAMEAYNINELDCIVKRLLNDIRV